MHYCLGCCTSKEQALANVKAAVVQGGLLGGFSSTTPSKSRHGSSTEAMGEQAAGIMCFDILPRAMAKAFPKWETGGQINDETDDKRAWMRAKAWRAKKYLESRRSKMHSVLVSWIAEPIDYLWMQLQYLDSRASTLFDLQHAETSPFAECSRALARMICNRLCKAACSRSSITLART